MPFVNCVVILISLVYPECSHFTCSCVTEIICRVMKRTFPNSKLIYIFINTILRMVLFALKTSFPNKNALKLFLRLVGFCVINSKRIFSSDMICFSLIKNSKKWNQYSMSRIIPIIFFLFYWYVIECKVCGIFLQTL